MKQEGQEKEKVSLGVSRTSKGETQTESSSPSSDKNKDRKKWIAHTGTQERVREKQKRVLPSSKKNKQEIQTQQ
jgi:hypothetical protein